MGNILYQCNINHPLCGSTMVIDDTNGELTALGRPIERFTCGGIAHKTIIDEPIDLFDIRLHDHGKGDPLLLQAIASQIVLESPSR